MINAVADKLRKLAAAGSRESTPNISPFWITTLHDAADEIEKLHAALREVSALRFRKVSDKHNADIQLGAGLAQIEAADIADKALGVENG